MAKFSKSDGNKSFQTETSNQRKEQNFNIFGRGRRANGKKGGFVQQKSAPGSYQEQKWDQKVKNAIPDIEKAVVFKEKVVKEVKLGKRGMVGANLNF